MEARLSTFNDDIKTFYKVNNFRPVFSDISYLTLVKNESQELVFLTFHDKNEMIGLIPLIKVPSKLFLHLGLPSLTPFTSLILEKRYNNNKTVKECYSSFESFVKAESIGRINFSTLLSGNYLPSFFEKGSRTTYQINLNQELEEIHAKFRSDKKRNIKKQSKDNISISFERNEEILRRLILKTYERQEKKPNWIDAIITLCNKYKNAYQVTAYIDSLAVSTLFFVYDDSIAYYLAGGFDYEIENYNAGPIVMWEGIKHAKKIGLEIFDFEGSDIPSIQKYFESFGAERKLFDSFSFTSKPFKLYSKVRKII